MLQILRDGSWITRERARAICLMLLAGYALVIVAMFATSDGRLDRFGRPLGTDFSQVWVAGKFKLEGSPAVPFDPVPHEARQRREFSETSGFFHWGYPPYFLVIAAFFALFPYAIALALWQLTTLPLYLATVRCVIRDPQAILVASAFPAVFVNLMHGHNGFLTAALLGGGSILVRTRPWISGLLFGLAAYKPQFGVLLPLALIAGRYWIAFAAASLTVAAMTLATWLVFGDVTWRAYVVSMEYSRAYVAEQGATGWHKIQTAFAAARLWGASLPLAYAAQGASSLAAAVVVALLWWRRSDWRLCGAALLIGALLATPYSLDYDLMVLGPAIALFAAYGIEKGFAAYEKSLLAFLWFMPLFLRNFTELSHVHVGVLAMLVFLGAVARREFEQVR
jgi:alpha-1,2-mannosyltransferase